MSSNGKQPAFTAPMERHTFAGVLLDLDGTLVDSKDAITKHWHKSLNLTSFADTVHELMLFFFFFGRIGKELGVDPNVILATAHGRRSIDTIRLYEPDKANWDC